MSDYFGFIAREYKKLKKGSVNEVAGVNESATGHVLPTAQADM